MKTNTRPRHGNLQLLTMHRDNLLDGQGGGGGTPPPTPFDFRSLLPEDLRKDSVFDPIKVKDANGAIVELGKGFAHAQKLIGANRLEAPRDDWKPEQWKAFYQKIGAPEKPEGYEMPDFKFAEGLALDKEKVGKWQAKFAEAGLSKKQAQQIMGAFFEDINGAYVGDLEASKTSRINAEKELREEYGDRYDANLDVARAVLKQHGSEDLVKFLGESGLANNPNMIRFLNKIGGLMMEDTSMGNGGGLSLGNRTVALQTIDKLKIDKDFQSALNNRTDPGHKSAVDRWLQLHKEAASVD